MRYVLIAVGSILGALVGFWGITQLAGPNPTDHGVERIIVPVLGALFGGAVGFVIWHRDHYLGEYFASRDAKQFHRETERELEVAHQRHTKLTRAALIIGPALTAAYGAWKMALVVGGSAKNRVAVIGGLLSSQSRPSDEDEY